MKANLLNKELLSNTMLLGAMFLCGVLFSQTSKSVKLKLIKVIDGDSTVIERTMPGNSITDLKRDLHDLKGNDIQVMLDVRSPLDEGVIGYFRHNLIVITDSVEENKIK